MRWSVVINFQSFDGLLRQSAEPLGTCGICEFQTPDSGTVVADKSNEMQAGKEAGRYANFFQIGYNAFEFRIDFGQEDGAIHTRMYLSPQHARVLRDLLSETLNKHNGMFGAHSHKPES